jgi:hypothetical protein
MMRKTMATQPSFGSQSLTKTHLPAISASSPRTPPGLFTRASHPRERRDRPVHDNDGSLPDGFSLRSSSLSWTRLDRRS